MNLLFDIEGDGLLPTLTQCWMIVAVDLKTKEEYIFTDHNSKYPSLKEGLDFLYKAESLAGHNIIGYDLIALRKLFNWLPNESTKLYDTMLMSQVLDYMRFNGKHSLAVWGEYLGFPKVEHEDWSKYSEEMLHRCRVDVELNCKVYNVLIKELSQMSTKKPFIKDSLRNEHITAQFCADAEFNGWLVDREEAEKLLAAMEKEMSAAEAVINPKLKLQVKQLEKEPKLPKWNKNGNYDANTAKYFSIEASDGKLEVPPIEGPFSKIDFVQPDAGSLDSVKLYLKSIGWVPDDWNWKKVGRDFIKVSEKLTTSSLELLGETGMIIDKYYTTRSRHSILKGWLESLDENNRLHGSCFTISTPTGRARHSGIVNVPSADSEWGPDIRKLFITQPGWKIIGADSSGNQFRALCHYLKNEEYTNTVINGKNEDGTDVHSKNAEVLSSILGEEVSRKVAKTFIYAYLFGAGGDKVSLSVTGKRDKKVGDKIKLEFAKRIPGLHELLKRVSEIYHKTEYHGRAWIPALDGRRVYCESQHKALNYLLQSFEAITCKAATAYTYLKLKEENIPFNPLIFYHDEIEFEVPEKYAERASEIAREGFRDAAKIFGVQILDGEAKIGNSWYDVH
jgi:DNA polymerase I